METRLLSSNGSDRATGYGLSSKLVRRGERLFAGWLDAPASPGGMAQARSSALMRITNIAAFRAEKIAATSHNPSTNGATRISAITSR